MTTNQNQIELFSLNEFVEQNLYYNDTSTKTKRAKKTKEIKKT